MKIARIQENLVTEFLTPVPGHTLVECFHPGVLAQCAEVRDEVELNWVRQDDGSFAPPPAPPAPTQSEDAVA